MVSPDMCDARCLCKKDQFASAESCTAQVDALMNTCFHVLPPCLAYWYVNYLFWKLRYRGADDEQVACGALACRLGTSALLNAEDDVDAAGCMLE